MLTKTDGERLLMLARSTVKDYFNDGKLSIQKTDFNEKQGVFVTLHDNKGGLRGCIGYPYPTFPLGEAVQRAAISAAFEDTRFRRLSSQELGDILFEISVLTKPELIEVKRPEEYLKKIKIGTDGLIIEHGLNSGLLLPQVAIEHGFDAEEFLENTCWKAGLAPDMWSDMKTRIYKFQAQIFNERSPKH